MNTGQRIKNLRKSKNLTQQQLADMLKISLMSVRRYEKGERIPSFETLMNLSKIFGVNLSELADDWLISSSTSYSINDLMPLESELQDYMKNLCCNIDFDSEPEIFEAIKTTFEHFRHISNDNRKSRLKDAFESLNITGQSRAIEALEVLAKVPEYQKRADDTK